MQAPHDEVSQPTIVPVSPRLLAQDVDEELARLDLRQWLLPLTVIEICLNSTSFRSDRTAAPEAAEEE